jgi:hypothetical protein
MMDVLLLLLESMNMFGGFIVLVMLNRRMKDRNFDYEPPLFAGHFKAGAMIGQRGFLDIQVGGNDRDLRSCDRNAGDYKEWRQSH